jgi:RHS repeat-associated protein
LLQATSSTLQANYKYDAFGRRIQKDVGGVITNYIYDGDQLIAEYDGSGNLTKKFIYGPGIDEPVCVIASDSEAIYFYHFDGLSSVSEITNAGGNVVEKYEYDAYGKTTIKDSSDNVLTQSAIGNRFGFTGRELDNKTGLYYYRARYYSPELGRFLQTDPLGIDDENTYTYCYNDSVNYTDPYGLLSLMFNPGAAGVGGFGIGSTSIGKPPFPEPLGPDVLPGPIILPPLPQPGGNTLPGAQDKGRIGTDREGISEGITNLIQKAAQEEGKKEEKGEKKPKKPDPEKENEQKQNPPPKSKKGNLRWDDKHKRWVDDAGVYTQDKRPHDKRGGGPHWDFGSWDGKQREWSPDGINWYPK